MITGRRMLDIKIHRILRGGAIGWAVIGAVIAFGSIGGVRPDARVLVAAFSIAGPLAALLAADCLTRWDDRLAGALLMVSALATPTYFAYVINLPALIVGLALLVVSPAGSRPRRKSHSKVEGR